MFDIHNIIDGWISQFIASSLFRFCNFMHFMVVKTSKQKGLKTLEIIVEIYFHILKKRDISKLTH